MLLSQDPNRDAWKNDGEEAGGTIVSREPPKKKGGLFEARIGSQHRVSGKSGHYTVRDYDQFARRDGVTSHVRCITCGRAYESIDAMRAAHPTPEAMRKTGEQHVWARWSEDALDPAQHDANVATYEERRAILGELTGETAYQAALAAHKADPKTAPRPTRPAPRILELQAVLREWGLANAKALVAPKVEIIGLLSSQPMIDGGEAEVALPGPDHSLK